MHSKDGQSTDVLRLNIKKCDVQSLSHKSQKFSNIRYRALGPELIPLIQAVSPQVTIIHPPGGRLLLLSARPAVTFPAAEHHRLLAGTHFTVP